MDGSGPGRFRPGDENPVPGLPALMSRLTRLPCLDGMSTFSRRCLLLVLAVSAAYVGVWAYVATASWYQSFPGFGRHWLPVLGPYNEHLAKDVGAMYLALAALSAGAALRAADTFVVRLVAVTWLVFSVPHLAYHLQHLYMYSGIDRPSNVVSLGFFVVAGAVLLLPTKTGRQG